MDIKMFKILSGQILFYNKYIHTYMYERERER